ncbi:hypothetical protein [Alkalihalobacillus deserti]|uniref:hypothetical protein n=1 Tax=Alkalihalobacillus deserti TaxID=2879466 RepID=UPI001D14B89E|nr:hypothetical protein [Alkalihalobacillus deserti]
MVLDEVRREVQCNQQKEQVHPRLQDAYALKNKVDEWFKESDGTTAKQGLEASLQAMKVSGIEA